MFVVETKVVRIIIEKLFGNSLKPSVKLCGIINDFDKLLLE